MSRFWLWIFSFLLLDFFHRLIRFLFIIWVRASWLFISIFFIIFTATHGSLFEEIYLLDCPIKFHTFLKNGGLRAGLKDSVDFFIWRSCARVILNFSYTLFYSWFGITLPQVVCWRVLNYFGILRLLRNLKTIYTFISFSDTRTSSFLFGDN